MIEEAGRWADRLSINVELPTEQAMQALAPEKSPRTIRRAMADVRARREAAQVKRHTGKRPPRFAPAGQSTQMIVGADAATDQVRARDLDRARERRAVEAQARRVGQGTEDVERLRHDITI